MEQHKKLRAKIRNFILENEQGFKTFFLHGQGGEEFPYEDDEFIKGTEKEEETEKKATDLGMEPISGDSLHLTSSNM